MGDDSDVTSLRLCYCKEQKLGINLMLWTHCWQHQNLSAIEHCDMLSGSRIMKNDWWGHGPFFKTKGLWLKSWISTISNINYMLYIELHSVDVRDRRCCGGCCLYWLLACPYWLLYYKTIHRVTFLLQFWRSKYETIQSNPSFTISARYFKTFIILPQTFQPIFIQEAERTTWTIRMPCSKWVHPER